MHRMDHISSRTSAQPHTILNSSTCAETIVLLMHACSSSCLGNQTGFMTRIVVLRQCHPRHETNEAI